MTTVPHNSRPGPGRGARADWHPSRSNPTPEKAKQLPGDAYRAGYYILGLEPLKGFEGQSTSERRWVNSNAHLREVLDNYLADGVGCYSVSWDGVE